jgi:hypothetical protein
MKITILCYATNGLSSVTGRTIGAYGLWIESRYVEKGWDHDIDDCHVYIVSYCLFMIIQRYYLMCLSLDVCGNVNSIFQLRLHMGKWLFEKL